MIDEKLRITIVNVRRAAIEEIGIVFKTSAAPADITRQIRWDHALAVVADTCIVVIFHAAGAARFVQGYSKRVRSQNLC